MRVRLAPMCGVFLALVWLPGCAATPQSGSDVGGHPPARAATTPCRYRESGFRAGVNPPRQVERLEPDWSAVPPLAPEQLFIVEVRIDATGRVTEDCVLRGVNPDADRPVLAAVRAWRLEPPRLIAAVDSKDGRWEAGAAS